MPRQKQLNIFNTKPKRGRPRSKPHDHFGGIYLKNYNPSQARPMDSKKCLHLVLRSSQAKGVQSFKNKKHEASIWEIIQTHAQRCGIRIYEYANSGNHLHILLRAKHRDNYKKFIRAITGLIARRVGRTQKGSPLKKKFWDSRPFSRVVSFAKKEFHVAKGYIQRNILESIGWVPYFSRREKIPAYWKAILYPALE